MAALPDFKALAAADHARLGAAGARALLAAGEAWKLAHVLAGGGALIFPHSRVEACGHLVAAVVSACLGCGAERVLVLGVLHALTPGLDAARRRVAAGGDPAAEASWGIQGPGFAGREDWRREFSLDHFLWLWAEATRERPEAPELILAYPYLAGGAPERLPGLERLPRDTALVATMDPFHHGLAYGDAPEAALAPGAGGLELARERIAENLALLAAGDHAAFQAHCVAIKSDARDVGQLLRHLVGPCTPRIHDLAADDMSAPYGAPSPSWVAAALIELASAPAGG